MSMNCSMEKLSYESVRKVVKKKSGRERWMKLSI
jgi:hypothetical protein